MGNDENNSLAWKETTVVIQRGFTKKERRGKNKNGREFISVSLRYCQKTQLIV